MSPYLPTSFRSHLRGSSNTVNALNAPLAHLARVPPDGLLAGSRALDADIDLLGDAPIGPVRMLDDQLLGEPADAASTARCGGPWRLRRLRR